jgi:hypothetical protein
MICLIPVGGDFFYLRMNLRHGDLCYKGREGQEWMDGLMKGLWNSGNEWAGIHISMGRLMEYI